MPDTVKEVKSFAFTFCQNLQTLYFSENVVNINHQMTDGAYALRDVFINDACTFNVGAANFRYCYRITFHINPTNTNVKLVDNVLYTKDMKNIIAIGYQADGVVEIPNTISSLTGIYSHCSLILPTSVKKVEEHAIKAEVKNIYYKGTEEDFNRIVVKVAPEETGIDENAKHWDKAIKIFNYE
jgi:hypothetical protein